MFTSKHHVGPSRHRWHLTTVIALLDVFQLEDVVGKTQILADDELLVALPLGFLLDDVPACELTVVQPASLPQEEPTWVAPTDADAIAAMQQTGLGSGDSGIVIGYR